MQQRTNAAAKWMAGGSPTQQIQPVSLLKGQQQQPFSGLPRKWALLPLRTSGTEKGRGRRSDPFEESHSNQFELPLVWQMVSPLFSPTALLPLSAAQIGALTLALLGLVLSFAAILTPSWQVVYARELDQWVQSGLWLNCQTRPSGMHTCVYSFSNADLSFYTQPELLNLRSAPFYGWQRPLLFALLAAQLLAFLALLSLCLSFHPPTRRLSAFAFIGCMALAVLLHSGSAVAFAILSQMVEYRFFHVSVSGIYEKHRGYSFYLELAAIAAFALSQLPAALHLLQVLRQPDSQKQRQYTRSRTPPPMGHFAGSSPDGNFWDEERFAMRQLPPLPPMANR